MLCIERLVLAVFCVQRRQFPSTHSRDRIAPPLANGRAFQHRAAGQYSRGEDVSHRPMATHDVRVDKMNLLERNAQLCR